ncbi:nucleotide exchange factor GrpE [Dactylosporangium sp. NPDC000555]|uniref:nucleotide exchange factor GrpE n=1 Tax=Dactylosporangium sp. NPDC000555 TaxID=3154260 RepID=UPI00332CA9E8
MTGEPVEAAEPTGPTEPPEAGGPERAEAAAELEELRDRWQRAAADADNARKRCDRLIAERTAAERLRVTTAWLPVLDHLDLALRHAEADPQSIVQGVAHVRQDAQSALARLGFEPIGAEGEPFDPARHEAAEAVEDPRVPPGTVVRVVRPGYGGPGGLLRPAIVAVARPPGPTPGSERPDHGG